MNITYRVYRSIPMNEFAPDLKPILEQCWRCEEMVPECEISPETDLECVSCQNIERCTCGDLIEDCKGCESLFEKAREWLIKNLKDFI